MAHPLLVLALLMLVAPRDAAAYIDPGAGSMILQLLLGGVAGIMVIGKLYYRRLLSFFRRAPRNAEQEAGPER